MGRLGFWLRWSLRDLRQRWVQVTALALVIALGVGVWSGLGGTGRWRTISYDRSLEVLNVHDLHVTVPEGTFVDEGALAGALAELQSAGTLSAVEERLVVATQVDASTDTEVVLVPGELVGVDTADGGPHVDRLDVRAGSGLAAGSVVLDVHFAAANDLAASGTVRLAGDVAVPYTGQALTADRLIVISERSGVFAFGTYAVVYAPLEVAQRLSGHEGAVNDAVITVPDGADLDAAAQAVDAALASALPDVGFTVTKFVDEPVYRLLYQDIEGDQRFYDIFAGLVFAGAVFGAFNLARRMVDAQRREIGISMAMGTPVRLIALRPMLVGLQIAVIGTLSGILVGLGISRAMVSVFEDFLPLPVWDTSIDWAAYAKGALLGVLVPLAGLAWPVFRAVRASPVETMTPLYRRRSRRAPRVGRRLRLPGSTIARFPVRNVLRSLQRTVLTVAAIAAVVAVFFAILAMLDSFGATINRGQVASQAGAPDRLTVDLASVMPATAPTVQEVGAAPEVGAVDGALRVPGALLHADGSDAFDAVIELRDLTGGLWRPVTTPALTGDEPAGVVLATKAARDLDVDVGDTVLLRHPRRTGLDSFEYVTSELPVLATHEIPLRNEVLIDSAHADLLNVAGLVNVLDVVPAEGMTEADVQRALFALDGVASVQSVGATVEIYEDLIDDFLGFLIVVEGVMLLVVALVAFNATSINVDERRREHATMLAFGVRVRTVLRTMVLENVLLGLAGGVFGVALGAVLVNWLMKVTVPDTMPDIDVTVSVAASSVALAIGAAVVTVALTPLMSVRRLRHLDVPSTLRVVE